MTRVAFICSKIGCGPNKAQFQRARLLATRYKVWFLARSGICEEVASLAEGVRVCPQKWGFPKLFFFAWAWWTVLKLRREHEVELVWTTHYDHALIAGYLLKRAGMKWVVDLWDTPTLGADLGRQRRTLRGLIAHRYHSLLFKIVKWILPKADLIVIGLHPEVLTYLGVEPNADNVLAVTNGVDLEITRPTEAGESSQPFSLVYVGPVQRARGIDVILQAAALLVKGAMDFRLRLVGPILQQERAWFEDFIASNGLAECTEMTGPLPHPEVLKLIGRSDVCLCPLSPAILNYRYAYPIKLFEYMAMGKAVVCTRMKGTEQIIRDGENGLLVQPDNPSALAKAILRLYREPALRKRLGQRARETVSEYDWSRINEQISEAIERLLSKAEK